MGDILDLILERINTYSSSNAKECLKEIKHLIEIEKESWEHDYDDENFENGKQAPFLFRLRVKLACFIAP